MEKINELELRAEIYEILIDIADDLKLNCISIMGDRIDLLKNKYEEYKKLTRGE